MSYFKKEITANDDEKFRKVKDAIFAASLRTCIMLVFITICGTMIIYIPVHKIL